MNKTSILDQIEEAIRLSEAQGKTPILIVWHPSIELRVIEEVQKKNIVDSTLARTLFRLPIYVSPVAKDFFIEDNRSWTEQKF